MRYVAPIRGKTLKKIVSPIQRSDLGGGIDSVMKLVGELTFLKQSIQSTFEEKIEEIDETISRVMEIQKGERGEPGVDADEQKIADWVMSQIRIPEDGNPEKIIPTVIKEVLTRLPKLPNEKDIVLKVLKQIPEHKPSLKVIREEMQLDKEALLDEILKSDKLKVKLDSFDVQLKALDRRYIHGGGDTVSAGTNITITNVNGTKQISASSGGFTILTTASTIDDSNVTFVFTGTPSVVVINGQSFNAGATVGGTIMWTNVGATVTLANAVGSGGSIWAIQ